MAARPAGERRLLGAGRASFHEDPDRERPSFGASTTAYIAWSVFSEHAGETKAPTTLAYLQDRADAANDDPYVLALVANALLAIQPEAIAAQATLDRLESLRRVSQDGKLVWWGPDDTPSVSRRTLFFGGDQSRRVETTAMAVLAMVNAGAAPSPVRGALAWLVARKDGQGTWGRPRPPCSALEASGRHRQAPGRRQAAADRDPPGWRARPGAVDPRRSGRCPSTGRSLGPHRLGAGDSPVDDRGPFRGIPAIRSSSATTSPTRAAIRERKPTGTQALFSIHLDYDRTTIAVDETVTVAASVTNNRPESAPMVILDLPIPSRVRDRRGRPGGTGQGGLDRQVSVTREAPSFICATSSRRTLRFATGSAPRCRSS